MGCFRTYAEIHGKEPSRPTPKKAEPGQSFAGARAMEEIKRRGYRTEGIGEVLALFLPTTERLYCERRPEVLQQLDGYSFELYVAERLRRDLGRDVVLTKKSGDRKADIIVMLPKEEIIIISAKQFAKNRVHSTELRELLKAMAYWKSWKGMLITASETGGGIRDWLETLKCFMDLEVEIVDGSNISTPPHWKLPLG